MRVPSRLLLSPAMAIALTAVVLAIAIVLLAANITITNAQQQPLTSQPTVTQNRTTLFQSTEDGIRLKVPQGWIIHDVNNTGSALLEESTQGYGILAQLCPQEQQQQQQAALSNVSGGDTASCQGSEEDIIHIVRYPDLETRLQVSNNVTANNITIDNILLYHMQKLQEVGYNGIEIVDSTETTANVTNAQTNQTIATVPAKLVEMTYSTNFAPNETRIGYFVLTATNATTPIPGITKGYSIFYEGNSAAAEITPSGSLAPTPTPLPAPARQVFGSFELVAARTEPLTVEITSSDTEGIAPATFEFEADVTGGTEPYTISWSFGDGSSEENDEDVEHTFEVAGTYNVDLTVTDSGSQSASDSMEITVQEALPAEVVVEEEEEEQQPLPPAEEEEVEEEEQQPLPPAEEEEEQPSLGDEIAESIEDEADAFVDDILDRFGVNN